MIVVGGTGGNSGVITSASYEARPFGLHAGMPTAHARKLCPQGIFINTNSEQYGVISRKIFAALDTISPMVEEASIDEGYIDLTGLRRLYKCSYGEIGKKMQEVVFRETGIPISIGITPTKTLSKIASDLRKPRGHVVITAKDIPAFLKVTAVKDVPGIGPNSQALLEKYRVKTCWDYVRLGEHRLKELFGVRGEELYKELLGISVYPVTNIVQPRKSISRGRTLARASADHALLYAHLVQNLAHLTMRLRRYGMSARHIAVHLRDQQFHFYEAKTSLPQYLRVDDEFLPYIRRLFNECYVPGTLYRYTGLYLSDLSIHETFQPSLFEDVDKRARARRLARASDQINNKFGRGAMTRASAAAAGDALIVCSFKKGSDIVNEEL